MVDKHFGVRKNVVYKQARFNTRRQQHGETGEQYILALYALIYRARPSFAAKRSAIGGWARAGAADTR